MSSKRTIHSWHTVETANRAINPQAANHVLPARDLREEPVHALLVHVLQAPPTLHLLLQSDAAGASGGGRYLHEHILIIQTVSDMVSTVCDMTSGLRDSSLAQVV